MQVISVCHYKIRKLHDPLDEEDEIHALHAVTFANTAPKPDIGEAVWWLASHQDTPVGFASIRACLNRCNTGFAYLHRCGVLPAHRGNGLQKRLLRARERWARKNRYNAVVTDCTNDNAPSANALIAAGYRVYEPAERWALKNSVYWIKRLS